MSRAMTELNLEQPRSAGGKARWATELSILLRIQIANVRDSWVWIILMATLFPLTTILFMMFTQPNPSEETITQIIAGNLIFGIIVMGMNGLGQDISWQKHQGHFTFYASLPISKINFVLANLFRGLMNTLPSLIILWWIGQWIFGVQLHLSPMLPVVFLLSLSSVVGFGILIGFWSPNHQLTNMLCQALMVLVTFLSPVMVTMDRLPSVLQWTAYVFPSTYAADAMRNILFVGWTDGVLRDCAVMLLFSVGAVVVVQRLVTWRVKK